MRYRLFILACYLIMSISAVEASEVILGVVNAVDKEKGIVVLKVIDSGGDGSGQPQPELLSVSVNPAEIPDFVVPDNTIRIWGEFAGEGKSLSFRADSIRGGSMNGGRHDPTGVRSRLGRGYQGGRGSRMGGGRSSGR